MRLLVFTASWCAPCRVQKAEIAKLQQSDPEKAKLIEIIDVENDETMHITESMAIRAIPTLVLLDDKNEVVKKQQGALTATKLVEFMTLPTPTPETK